MDSLDEPQGQEESLEDGPPGSDGHLDLPELPLPSVEVDGEIHELPPDSGPLQMVMLDRSEAGDFPGVAKVLERFGVHVRHNSRSQLDEIYFPPDFSHFAALMTDKPLDVHMAINGEEVPRKAFEGFTVLQRHHVSAIEQLLSLRARVLEYKPVVDDDGNKSRKMLPVKARGWSHQAVGNQLEVIAHINAYDPLKEWIVDNWSNNPWDGEERLKNLFFDYGLVPQIDADGDTLELRRYLEWCGKALILSMVYRAFRETYKWDICWVISGPQGCGKQTFLSRLVPGWGRREQGLFRPLAKLVTGGEEPARKNAQNLLGASLVELDEMAGVSINSQDGQRVLKSFLTTEVDYVTFKYERQARYLPRRYVLVATMNDDGSTGIPDDSSGLRRWAPIKIADGNYSDIVDLLDEQELSHLYAEAYQCLLNRESPLPPADVAATAHQIAQEMENVDPLTAKALEAGWDLWNANELVEAQTVAQKVGLLEPGEPINRSISSRIGRMLSREFEKKELPRENGVYKGRHYKPRQ